MGISCPGHEDCDEEHASEQLPSLKVLFTVADGSAATFSAGAAAGSAPPVACTAAAAGAGVLGTAAVASIAAPPSAGVGAAD